jgi:hypothetical protein
MEAQPLDFSLRHLEQCLTSRESISQLKLILDKIEKCCSVIEKRINLAEILQDEANLRSLSKAFGKESLTIGMQLILKLALKSYSLGSFTVRTQIEGSKKIEFLFRSLGGWKEFDGVISFLTPQGLIVINPQKRAHWQKLQVIPAGTLMTFYFKTLSTKRSTSQEELAIERAKTIFDLVQSRSDLQATQPTPAIRLSPEKKKQYSKYTPTFPSRTSQAPQNQTSALTFQLVINKMDTFVHAGNAQLIVSHLSEYPGRIEMHILRGKRVKVQIDADSIWGAEIRNGETLVFDFFGPRPSETYVKALANKTNKYTQMDKIVNE